MIGAVPNHKWSVRLTQFDLQPHWPCLIDLSYINFLFGSQARRTFLVLCRRTNAPGFSLVLLAAAFFLPGCAKRNEVVKSVEPGPRVESPIGPAARVLPLAS